MSNQTEIRTLLDLLVARMPEGPALFPGGEVTDHVRDTAVAVAQRHDGATGQFALDTKLEGSNAFDAEVLAGERREGPLGGQPRASGGRRQVSCSTMNHVQPLFSASGMMRSKGRVP